MQQTGQTRRCIHSSFAIQFQLIVTGFRYNFSNRIGDYSGDGVPAINAELLSPEGIAFDPSGNIYFTGGTMTRKISSSGIIMTIAGNGMFGFSVDGGPATDAALTSSLALNSDASGNLYFTDGERRVSASFRLTGFLKLV